VQRYVELPESDDAAFEYARAALAAPGNARLDGVYNVGPGSFGISRAVAQHGYGAELRIVAHDLLEVHRSMLLSGAIDYVLQQDVHYAVTAAARVLRALCEGVRGALATSNPRVEILTAENLA
jgi:LacI family transcriptional regulator